LVLGIAFGRWKVLVGTSETKKSVRQIKNTPKDLIHGQLNGKKPVETRETEMSGLLVLGIAFGLWKVLVGTSCFVCPIIFWNKACRSSSFITIVLLCSPKPPVKMFQQPN
jgi:hypothetical protein